MIFWGIKIYEPLSCPPPPLPIIKICEWGPWDRVWPRSRLKFDIPRLNILSHGFLKHYTVQVEILHFAHPVLHTYTTRSFKIISNAHGHYGKSSPGTHSHILLTGGEGSKGFFGIWNFGQKGFFWVYERRLDVLGRKKSTGIFLGIVLFISSNQQ